MPEPRVAEAKIQREWQGYDTANTSIGQGYVLVNPMQLAVMAGADATGKLLQPRLLMARSRKPVARFDVDPEHLEFVRKAMGAWSTNTAPRSARSSRSTAS